MTTELPDEPVEAALEVLGHRARRDAPLGPMTTYRVGGPAALMVELTGEGDLDPLRRAVAVSALPVLVVGKGSNLLVADSGFPGLVVTLGEPFAGIEITGAEVRAGGAASLPVVARRSAAAGLTGLEWAVGVPGSVGGGVRMNAGGHGSEISRRLVSARVADLGAAPSSPVSTEVAAEDLALSYRHSALTPLQVVLEATFALEVDRAGRAEAEIAEVVRWRRDHQPGGQNAGSVFTNPPGDSAGRLIEEAGLKGLRRGSAHVSTKHANFFGVDPGGSADDVRGLMEEVAAAVAARTGVVLDPEVRMIGFAPWSQPTGPDPAGHEATVDLHERFT